VESLKELAEQRSKLVVDARRMLDAAPNGKLSAEDEEVYAKLEKDIEAACDKIDERTKADGRKDRLRVLEARLSEPLPRQVPPGRPGEPRPGTDGAALSWDPGSLTWDFGRAGKLSVAELGDEDEPPPEQLLTRSRPEYERAFRSYLRYRPGKVERLGLMVGVDPKGGYLVPMTFLTGLIKFLDDEVTMRRLATVLPPTTAKSVGALSYDTDYNNADWTPEVPASDLTEDDSARFGVRELTPHLLTKFVKTSRKMLRSSTFPLETFLQQRLAYKFGITENGTFLTGDGAQKPLGVFTASDYGIPTSRDVTASSATAFTADDVIDLVEGVKDVYQRRGTILATREFRKRARKLKSGGGDYLLTEMNNSGTMIPTLMGHPLIVDENAPNTFTAGQYVAVFGDFRFYYIQDGIDLELQRLDELLALRNQVGWVARKETDGMPVLAEAFARLKLAA
jgi:HK97 family phage major capsid protein